MREFKRTVVGKSTLDAFSETLPDYEVMLVTVLDAILERYERNPGYPFIDTKLSILTGEDFAEPDDESTDFKGPTAIYAWIQGRGLESLVGHAKWLARCSVLTDDEKARRGERLREMIMEVFDAMETLRALNGGRLFFTMTPHGEPFDMDAAGRRRRVVLKAAPYNFSDLFYAKGMFAVAREMGMGCVAAGAKDYFRRILADILHERFRSDQVPLNPNNPMPATEGQFAQGPRMIALGGVALLAGRLGGEEWFEAGERLLRDLMERHLNLGQFPGLERGDYFEVRDAEGNPWKADGTIRNDPGHALEFVGLASKFLLELRAKPEPTVSQRALLDECVNVFPDVFMRNFENGYHPKIGGIIKNFDLVGRTPLSDEMPWWSLPETMRAAAELLVLCPDTARRDEIVDALVKCSNGFMTHFVNPDCHLMAYQTIGPDGKPVDRIPATTDADPGYHTGLSLIDMIDCLREV